MITSFFNKLFTVDTEVENPCIMGAIPPLSQANRRGFEREVTKSDIFNVVSRMGAFKAPGVDGLQAGFLQS